MGTRKIKRGNLVGRHACMHELVEDLPAIVTSFSGRLYGMRSRRRRRWWRVSNVQSVSSARFVTPPLRMRAKYWRRERNRTNQIMHVVSKQIAEIAERERLAVAFEGIKEIRKSMRSKRKSKNSQALRKDMRRRLNQWPFRKLQFYTDYKVVHHGLPTVEVSNYHKSKDCPICGHYNRPNGHTYRCEACGFEASRHLVASWNIAKDGARHVPADCWQMQRTAEELVAPAKLPVEPEKIPVQAGVQFDTEF